MDKRTETTNLLLRTHFELLDQELDRSLGVLGSDLVLKEEGCERRCHKTKQRIETNLFESLGSANESPLPVSNYFAKKVDRNFRKNCHSSY